MINVFEWIKSNRLLLNFDKSHFMILSSSRKVYDPNKLSLNVDGNEIKQVTQCKFLGVVVDNNFTWKPHIQYITNKVSKGIGILNRSKQFLFSESLLTLYNSLLKPHFTYCLISWGNTTKSNLNVLYLLQKKIVRILTGSDYRAHSEPLFVKLKIMNIFQLHHYFTSVFVFKCLSNMYFEYWDNFFHYSNSPRFPNDLQTKYFKKKLSQSSIRFSGPQIWNNFSTKVKMSTTLPILKRNLRHEILSL